MSTFRMGASLRSPLNVEDEENQRIPEIPIFDEDSSDDGSDDGSEDDIEIIGSGIALSPDQDLSAPYARLTISEAEPVPNNHVKIDSFQLESGTTLKSGKTVEDMDGDFLRITSLFRHRSARSIILRGIQIRRCRRMNNRLPKKVNEVCAVLNDVEIGVANPKMLDYQVDVPLDNIICVRRCIFTNKVFAACKFSDSSWRDNAIQWTTWSEIEESAVLVCRWKYIEYSHPKTQRPTEGAMLRLRQEESDPGKGVPDAALKHWWRHLEAAGEPPSPAPAPPTAETQLAKFVPAGSPFTYGDICTGCGGALLGAKMAGLKPTFALDSWAEACKTLKLNYGRSLEVIHRDINYFCTKTPAGDYAAGDYAAGDYAAGDYAAGDYDRYYVDVEHISHPCQYWAHCKTTDGKDDDANSAAGFSIIPLLRKSRPRIVTLEQTSGLYCKHPEAFNALVHQATAVNYSIRWKLAYCGDHGHVQNRKRLFCFASCPGEQCPTFPPARTSTRPTINSILAKLPSSRDTPPHMKQHSRKEGPRYDGNLPLKQLITTNGGEGDLHPRGHRGFTCQEFALLMGFPTTFKFPDTTMGNIKRMCGNAVPVETAKDMFRSVIPSLRDSDREMRAWLGVAEEAAEIEEVEEDTFLTASGSKRKQREDDIVALSESSASEAKKRASHVRSLLNAARKEVVVIPDNPEVVTIDD